jgi:hypothetical protein
MTIEWYADSAIEAILQSLGIAFTVETAALDAIVME